MIQDAAKSFHSTYHFLLQIQDGVQDYAPEDMHIYERLLGMHSSDLRVVVDGVVGLSAGERKEYLAPYKETGKRLKKFDPKGYRRGVGLQL